MLTLRQPYPLQPSHELARDSMIMLDDDLQRLVRAGKIDIETARRFAKDQSAITATTANAW